MAGEPWRFDSLAPSGPWISGHVGEDRHLPAHGLVDLHLAGGVGEVIDAADHVRDAHVVVVDDDGVVVDRRAVAAQDDHVVEVGVLPHDAALHPVLDHGLAVERRLEADHRLDAGRRILGIAVAPAAVVHASERARRARASRISASSLAGCAVAVVGLAGGQQLLGHLAVALSAGKLIERLAVPIELEPFEAVEDGRDRGLGGALAIGILDPQQHLAAGVAGVEPVEQRRARTADVQIAGGRGRKARDDGLGHVAVSCYLAEGSGVIPGLVPGIQPSASCGAGGAMDPGDKRRDDSGGWRVVYHISLRSSWRRGQNLPHRRTGSAGRHGTGQQDTRA